MFGLSRVYMYCLAFSILFSKSSSLFIEVLRDVGNLAVASNCPSWSFDSSPLIFFLIWYLSYEELISNPFCFQRNNVYCNRVVILVVIWRLGEHIYIHTYYQAKRPILCAKRRIQSINNLENSFNCLNLRILKCLRKTESVLFRIVLWIPLIVYQVFKTLFNSL